MSGYWTNGGGTAERRALVLHSHEAGQQRGADSTRQAGRPNTCAALAVGCCYGGKPAVQDGGPVASVASETEGVSVLPSSALSVLQLNKKSKRSFRPRANSACNGSIWFHRSSALPQNLSRAPPSRNETEQTPWQHGKGREDITYRLYKSCESECPGKAASAVRLTYCPDDSPSTTLRLSPSVQRPGRHARRAPAG
ncbi:hypothetical protein ON010_g7220 [Phytophthora cinnamomi]|nr:hypothetical protein ON010_g7220 [Phytophthora cinnamomi]